MEYKLTMNAPLPQQQVVLSVPKNEVQLIELMCEELQKLDDVPLNTSLVITVRYPVPMEVKSKALFQNSGKALWHRFTIDYSSCNFRMRQSWMLPWYREDKGY